MISSAREKDRKKKKKRERAARGIPFPSRLIPPKGGERARGGKGGRPVSAACAIGEASLFRPGTQGGKKRSRKKKGGGKKGRIEACTSGWVARGKKGKRSRKGRKVRRDYIPRESGELRKRKKGGEIKKKGKGEERSLVSQARVPAPVIAKGGGERKKGKGGGDAAPEQASQARN